MGSISVIISALSTLLGSSAFADAVHALFTSLKAADPQKDYAAETEAAIELVKSGTEMATVVESLIGDYQLAKHHAMLIAAAAHAVVNKKPADSTTS